MFRKNCRNGLLGVILLLASLSLSHAQIVLEDFEYATSEAAVVSGLTSSVTGTGNAITLTGVSGTSTTQGNYGLKVTMTFGTVTDNYARFNRTLASTVTLDTPLSLTDLANTCLFLDIKGDVNLAGKRLMVYVEDTDGERFRFGKSPDAAVSSSTTTTYDRLPYMDIYTAGDNQLTAVRALRFYVQDLNYDAVESGSIIIDNLRLMTYSSTGTQTLTYRTITTDGDVSDWDGLTPVVTDPQGDGETGRDVTAIYMANDSDNLYVRLHSANANGYDGNELLGIDGDNSSATGFNLCQLGLGCDTLLAGASLFGQTTASYNSGAATPASVGGWGPYTEATDIEWSIPLNTAIPGDIAACFPGGLGSTVGLLYNDNNKDAGDMVAPWTVTLAEAPDAITTSSVYCSINVDGDISDWAGIEASVTDNSGDGGTGRDVAAIYLANDSDYLYVRIKSHAADGFDGNELIGIDGDNSTATGFNLFGLGLGSDTLAAGASLYGETTASFNAGAATPAAVTAWSASSDSLNIELSIPLTTVIPGDITSSFPGGLGSTIALAYGDSNTGATDTAGPVTYKLSDEVPLANYHIQSPYETIDWSSIEQLKACLHNHTENTNVPIGEWNDGVVGTVAQRVAHYESLGFGIMAITEHDYVSYPWSDYGVTSSTMIAVAGNELSKNTHMLSYFCDYYDNRGAGTSVTAGFEQNIQNVASAGGIMYIAHPHRPGGATADPLFDIQLLQNYPHIKGLEVINAGQFTNNFSEEIWDETLTALMPGRPVWGTASDDAHSVSASNGSGFTWVLLDPANKTELAVRDALETGKTYFSSWRVELGVDDAKLYPGVPAPTLLGIVVNQTAGIITLQAEGSTQIQWVSTGGQMVASGASVNVNTTPGVSQYIRARLYGPGGQTMTQPFGLVDLSPATLSELVMD